MISDEDRSSENESNYINIPQLRKCILRCSTISSFCEAVRVWVRFLSVCEREKERERKSIICPMECTTLQLWTLFAMECQGYHQHTLHPQMQHYYVVRYSMLHNRHVSGIVNHVSCRLLRRTLANHVDGSGWLQQCRWWRRVRYWRTAFRIGKPSVARIDGIIHNDVDISNHCDNIAEWQQVIWLVLLIECPCDWITNDHIFLLTTINTQFPAMQRKMKLKSVNSFVMMCLSE